MRPLKTSNDINLWVNLVVSQMHGTAQMGDLQRPLVELAMERADTALAGAHDRIEAGKKESTGIVGVQAGVQVGRPS